MLKKEKLEKEKKEKEEKEKIKKRIEEKEERQRKEKEKREKEENKIRKKIIINREEKKKNKEKINNKNDYGNYKDNNKDKKNILDKSRKIKKQKNLKENPIRIFDKFKEDLHNLKTFNQQNPLNSHELDNLKIIADSQDYTNSNSKSKFRTLFSDDQKTEMEELELKKRRVYFVKKKNKLNKYNIGIYSDPLNPYLTNWTRSFLKIGFNTGIWANKAQYGVPLLRLQRLRPKLEFPPIYKIKYNQFSEEKNYKNNYNITYNDNKKINDEYSLDSSLNNFFN